MILSTMFVGIKSSVLEQFGNFCSIHHLTHKFREAITTQIEEVIGSIEESVSIRVDANTNDESTWKVNFGAESEDVDEEPSEKE